ncbi:hypothetical protein BJ878DRAFT_524182 [Calycina marina]|uniref:Uncharacterized protein n=1 Tax=Calycina marina TaxID=1763456 RepID=A0A9P8CBB3_9HELO|nr:hypothetical protein BJ878DRAFT_524182 [Calycina marina]
MSTKPTKEQVEALFGKVEEKFSQTTLGKDRWYLIAIPTLIVFVPEHGATLYTYLINKPEYSTSELRQALIRRIREALLECISIQGVCKPLETLLGISQIEREEDKDYSFSRERWNVGPETYQRGKDWLNTIYKHNQISTDDAFAAHKDITFVNYQITYGFYLSDMTILGPIETELVTLSGIMIQNIARLTGWHLRGIRRVGVSKEDVELVQQCIELIAKFGNIKLENIPRVDDIEHEV